MTVAENYRRVCDDIAKIAQRYDRDPKNITLVAVTKKIPWEQASPAYDAGCHDFGESYVQEAFKKLPNAPQDIRWHLIGALQRKKVHSVIGKFHLIHSVESVELAKKISSCSEELGVITPILLEANTSGEQTKHGLSPDDWKQHFEQVITLPGLSIEGLMTIAPFVDDEKVIRDSYSKLRILRDDLKSIAKDRAPLRHLSMGMTNDYPYAIAEGATIVRIGTAIFGDRQSFLG